MDTDQPRFDSGYIDRLRFPRTEKERFKRIIAHMTEASVEAGGVRIHLDVIEAQKPRGVVVFSPGTGVYASVYLDLLDALRERNYTVVGIHHRGHGRSGGERGDFTVPELVEDAKAAITHAVDQYGPKLAMLGDSQGGIVSLYTALQDDRVKSLACNGIADLGGPGSERLVKHNPFAPLFRTLLPTLAGMAPSMRIPYTLYLDHAGMRVPSYGDARTFLEADELSLTHVTLRAVHSLASDRLPRPMSELQAPLLLLHPEKDEVFSKGYVMRLFDKVRVRKKFHVLRNRHHLAIVKHGREVAIPVADWFDETL